MLYVVSSPIGNLGDITSRALLALKEADYILAEDTRKTGLLLKQLNIEKKPLVSFYEHNEKEKIPGVIEYLKSGKKVVLISAAGTPLLSDPGFNLIRKCVEEKLVFTSLPGPSAITNALVLAGLPCDSFIFLGFLPRKKGKKSARLKELKSLDLTIVFFESPFRLYDTLIQVKEILGERRVCICREMTKLYEEVTRGTLSELQDRIKDKQLKGEITVVVSKSASA